MKKKHCSFERTQNKRVVSSFFRTNKLCVILGVVVERSGSKPFRRIDKKTPSIESFYGKFARCSLSA